MKTLIPEYTKESLDRYILSNIRPGDFVCSYLANELFEALKRADTHNIAHFVQIGAYISNYLPLGAYGSYEKIDNWLQLPAQAKEYARGLYKDRILKYVDDNRDSMLRPNFYELLN